MASELKARWVLYVLLFVSNLQQWGNGEPQVPCYFIFGDSLADNGNNNDLQTAAKVNYPPYGIDFPKGPTGRFSNGRNMFDIIAELLGFDNYIPPFAKANCEEALRGVNYASGAAGIRIETGQQLGARISMDNQLKNHRTTISNIVNILGNKDSAGMYLSKCLYTVTLGSNDYINNYFVPESYPTSRLHTPEQYAGVLIEQYSQQLKTLYNYGARKVALFGLGMLGCALRIVATHSTNGSPCVQNFNYAGQLFNNRLISLVDDLNKNLTDAKFTYINMSSIASPSASLSASLVTNASCCEVERGQDTCIPFRNPCSNRTQYVFWDAVHLTETMNLVFAGRAYSAQTPTDAYPFDISRLAQL